jgi:autoinducer 2-degrading protein
MFIVCVHVHVKPDCIEAFKEASLANARNSVKEPGIARFDVLQQQDDRTRFVLVEVYRTAQGDRALQDLARYGGILDGRAAICHEVRQCISG